MKISIGYGGLPILLTLVATACHGLAIPANDVSSGSLFFVPDVMRTEQTIVSARSFGDIFQASFASEK